VDADVTAPVPSYRTNLVTALLGAWLITGVLLDAWAHSNVPQLESVFTPWHAVLYSGFLANAGWIGWTARAAFGTTRPNLRIVPTGYSAATVAVAVFAVSAAGDLTWHAVFGIEHSINILFSPTHLGLAAAMFVIVTTPYRAALADPSLPNAPGTRRLLPVLLAAAFAASLVLLFGEYADALSLPSADVVTGLSNADDSFTARLGSAVALTNLVLVVPLLVLARSWTLPFGTATIIYTVAGVLSGALTGFAEPYLSAWLLPTGLVLDLLARLLRPGPDRRRQFLAFAGLAPLLTWTAYIAVARTIAPPLLISPDLPADRIPTAVLELYTGFPIVQALAGILTGVLLVGTRPHATQAPR
jgi:hypothetical protein